MTCWPRALCGAVLAFASALAGPGPGGAPRVLHPGQRPFTLVGVDDGLPAAGAIGLTQDRSGFIWMGTEVGLVRYSRGQCRRWDTKDGLPAAYIGVLLPDPEAGLWIATHKGLVRFREGRFEPARLGGKPSAEAVSQLVRDARGRLVASTATGLFRQREGLDFDVVPGFGDEPAGVLAAGPRSGDVYLARRDGVEVLHPDGTRERWGRAEGLPDLMPTLVAEDGQGRVWAGAGGTLLLKGPGQARFTDASRRLPGSLSPNSTPLVDRDGSLWIPTQQGALHLDGDASEVLDMKGGLPFRWVRTLFRDREGSLWVVGSTVARLQGGGRVANYTLGGGASGELVWSILRDRAGRLRVGTDDGAATLGIGGLERIPATEGRRIKAMAEDRQGTLWMVSTIGPALWLRPGQARAEPAPVGELGTPLNSVMEDSEGRLWLGHARAGLLRWDPAARRLVVEVGPGIAGAEAMGAFQIREDARGRLWAGTTAGLLVRTAPGAWKLFTARDGLQPNNVRGMAFLPDGSAWVHYQEPQGLTRVRLDGDRLTVLEHRTAAQGLLSDLNYAVEVDALGRVWTSTDQGLFRLDPPLRVGRNEGMIDEDCSIHALFLEGGRVWVGTSGGLVRYESGDDDAAAPPPQAQVVQVQYGRQPLEPPFPTLDPVPHRDNTVVFRIAAPSYLNERALRFQVRLEGLEDAWRDVENRTVRYPGLGGGRYRFEVRAAQSGGAFGPVDAFEFRVRPHWWITPWSFALQGLASIAIVYGIVRWRVAALARSRAELAAEVQVRTEELRARNAELSEALAHVHQLSGLLPICAGCKKIRDDQGAWTPLETYISSHSDADFTHGMCPVCMKEFYPEVGGT